MKRIYKKIFITVFFISLFIFTNEVRADYNATAVNPSDASCSLTDNSTGFCYYSNKELNEFVRGVIWLDTGDEVVVHTDYETIPSTDTNICSDYYVYTSFYYGTKDTTYNGYYCNQYLQNNEISEELKEEFKNAGFPESYYSKLAILKQAHPNWIFKAIDTKLNFEDAVKGETDKAGWNLVQLSVSNNYAYLAIDSTSFDYINNKFIEYDDKGSSNPWHNANYDTVAYYMDPRNFLKDMYIFQFEGLSYDSSISDENYLLSINEVFKDDYLFKYSNDFLNAGKESKVSPVYLASLSKQEVGGSTAPTTAIDGLYNKMFNFYNIGAYAGENPVLNGLNFASNTDEATMRPWDTEYKAIVGGALWMNDMYISVGQDTSFFKKWNVVHDYLIETGKVENPYSNYHHQYMTNIMAPSSEAISTYSSYKTAGLIDSGFVFYIPVYNNMPEETSLPKTGGWPNNYLSSISLNDINIAGFNCEIDTYNYYLDINTKEIKLDAIPISNKAKVNGTGTFEITEDTTKVIEVVAENGNIKKYQINITLTGEKKEDPIDVLTTLNNSGIKNNDKYLSGFELGTDISYIKEKIANANGSATVLLKDSNGAEKNSGKLSTGDKVSVTVGNETKEYEVVVYGDANGDGEINAIDYVRIRKYIMNTVNLSGANAQAADVNKDGNVDAIDYVKIRKYIMNTTTIEQ